MNRYQLPVRRSRCAESVAWETYAPRSRAADAAIQSIMGCRKSGSEWFQRSESD